MCCPVAHTVALLSASRGARRDPRGRFIAGLAGEQFALPEAVGLLRQVRNRTPGGELVMVSGCDPLNLVGTLLPGTKVPAVAGNRLLYRDGVPVASRVAGKYLFAVEASASEQDRWRQLLLRDTAAQVQPLV